MDRTARTLYLSASYEPDRPSQPQAIEGRLHLDPVADDAVAVAAQFLADHPAPKSVGLRATVLHANNDRYPYITWHARLLRDGVNGGVNETGLSRYRRLLRWAAEHGIPVVWEAVYSNAYPTQADLEAAVA